MIKVKQQERVKYSFYQGEVELEYDPIDHVYLVDGEEVPSVTSVVKVIDKSAVLINWAVKLTAERILASVHFPISEENFKALVLAAKLAHREKLEDAGSIGKQAHHWIETNIKLWIEFSQSGSGIVFSSLLLPSDERVKNCCIAALDWIKKHNVRWVCTERKIYSQVFEYAGTLDGIARVDSCDDPLCCPEPFKDRLSLIDWKSSNQLYIEYLFQTAAYQEAYEEETGEKIEDRWVIRLGKDDGEFEAWHLGPETYDEDFSAFENCLCLTQAIKSVNLRMKEFKKLKKKKIKKEKK